MKLSGSSVRTTISHFPYLHRSFSCPSNQSLPLSPLFTQSLVSRQKLKHAVSTVTQLSSARAVPHHPPPPLHHLNNSSIPEVSNPTRHLIIKHHSLLTTITVWLQGKFLHRKHLIHQAASWTDALPAGVKAVKITFPCTAIFKKNSFQISIILWWSISLFWLNLFISINCVSVIKFRFVWHGPKNRQGVT